MFDMFHLHCIRACSHDPSTISKDYAFLQHNGYIMLYLDVCFNQSYSQNPSTISKDHVFLQHHVYDLLYMFLILFRACCRNPSTISQDHVLLQHNGCNVFYVLALCLMWIRARCHYPSTLMAEVATYIFIDMKSTYYI